MSAYTVLQKSPIRSYIESHYTTVAVVLCIHRNLLLVVVGNTDHVRSYQRARFVCSAGFGDFPIIVHCLWPKNNDKLCTCV